MTLGLVLAVSAWPRPAAAWQGWSLDLGAWDGLAWVPVPAAFSPVPLPYGSRFYYPPGHPLSYHDPGSGTTYCLSQHTGFYYVCGYSWPGRGPAEPTSPAPPRAVPSPGDQGPSLPSGVFLFRLPQGAEATVDGVPVGLSGGLGASAVTPGRHQVVVRVSGTETEHTVTVDPHAMFTVTSTAILPADP